MKEKLDGALFDEFGILPPLLDNASGAVPMDGGV